MSTFGSDCPCKNNSVDKNNDGTITQCCMGLSNENLVPPQSIQLTQGEELIFPNELQLKNRKCKHFVGERTEMYLPVSLSELVNLKTKFPRAIVLGGFYFLFAFYSLFIFYF